MRLAKVMNPIKLCTMTRLEMVKLHMTALFLGSTPVEL